MQNLIIKQKNHENVAKTIITNLNKRQIEGYYCQDKVAALNKVLELMPKGSSIGWGGSMTLIETGVIDRIQNENYKVINRDWATNLEEQRQLYGEI